MPTKLTIKAVSDFIKSKNDTLISTEYKNADGILNIKCHACNEIYEQTYRKFYKGNYHPFCKDTLKNVNINKEPYKTPVKIKPVICRICSKEFRPRMSSLTFCSMVCSKINEQSDMYKQRAKIYGQIGGKISATKQSKRSKNEVYFSELCENYFEITTNEPYFDGWDADVIIHDKKLAILWNGAWHYKQISKTQSLKQVQARDKVKTAIIEKYGYTPYVIKDMGKHNKAFVEQEFEIFLLMRIATF